MMPYLRPRFSFFLAMTASLIGLSGCLGSFENQPKRYNYVTGAKHAPILNPGGSNYQAPEIKGEAQKSQAMTVESAQNPALAPSAGMSTNSMALQQASNAPEPSPLFYYNQQQSSVAASELNPVPPEAVEAMNIPQSAGVRVPAPMASENLTQSQNALDPSPLAMQNAPATPTMQYTEFPVLQNVPDKASPALQQNFDDAKQKAAAFQAVNPPSSTPDLSNQPLKMDTQNAMQPIPPAAIAMDMPVAPAPTESVMSDIALDQAMNSVPSPQNTQPEMIPIAPPSPLLQQTPAPYSPPVMAPVAQPISQPGEPVINALAPTPVAPHIPDTYIAPNAADSMVNVPTPAPVASTPFIPQEKPIRLIAPNSINPNMREIPLSRYSRMRTNPGLNTRPFH